MNTSTEKQTKNPTKTKRKTHNKQLHKRIHEIGVHKILFPDNLAGSRHPYTQEVTLLADSRGLNQTKIAEICGVSQSQVSKWVNGEDRATDEKITPLIRKISPVAPGSEFHHFKVVKNVGKTLPDDWEKQMLAWHIRQGSYYNDSYSVQDLERDLLGNMMQRHEKEKEQLESRFTSTIESLNYNLASYKRLLRDVQDENESNKTELQQYDQAVHDYLDKNPELNQMKQEAKERILADVIEDPDISHNAQSRMDDFSARLIESLELDDSDIEEQLQKLNEQEVEQHVREREALAEQHRKELDENEFLNKFNHEVELVPFELKYHDSTPEELEDLAYTLYGDKEFSLKSRGKRAKYADIFIAYVTGELAYWHKLEEIQLCGTQLLESETADVYRLFNNRLALHSVREVEKPRKRGFYYDDEDDSKHLKYCYIYDSAEELLNEVKGDISEEDTTEWRKKLIEAGYIFSSVRTVY